MPSRRVINALWYKYLIHCDFGVSDSSGSRRKFYQIGLFTYAYCHRVSAVPVSESGYCYPITCRKDRQVSAELFIPNLHTLGQPLFVETRTWPPPPYIWSTAALLPYSSSV